MWKIDIQNYYSKLFHNFRFYSKARPSNIHQMTPYYSYLSSVPFVSTSSTLASPVALFPALLFVVATETVLLGPNSSIISGKVCSLTLF
eukprot:m.233575 g.233575  ORF g.233575 m.233575 type:complete len:89 (+) comp16027_c2_seq14:263-529(+)